MEKKYGLSKDESLTDIIECASYYEAVQGAYSGTYLLVYYEHGRWWF